MGMFDSFYEGSREDYDAGIDWTSREWQTKAYDCNLDVYVVGDKMPAIIAPYPASYQVEIMGSRKVNGEWTYPHSLATVIDGVLFNIDNERAHSLPLINYSGHLTTEATA